MLAAASLTHASRTDHPHAAKRPDKCVRDYQQQPAPYLTPAAARFLVERGIEHLVLDVPSADRADDEGRLSAHRIFFGLPSGSQALAEATRAQCTITELPSYPM